ncbi:Probable ATP-dependent transporter SufC,cysteine desulfurase ATPase component,ABC-type transport system involved in Fe-S cluster assembly, ATPase component,FeS assembly ATPase SufC,ABC transporter [Chlamydia serpentis]|uniref:Probable ATP-dependent transporter SufC,cysteine desulfurase ATPase component,ABC-type transport system involved in Fe-S cluster assembly, ATPase component,FeS assembly ATPase SufC,ABC transporter n=1 Tax=Chlamydia serpentis TaxID=1967782 RepID=A0A2R8FBK2_9CHLA|nr:Fe-S cluster assembly ATPase SufC [Chlamydia serpentis]SPN73809.1 Probable ATP-dependent transporter SufC,cysteine desulfurase ATPase component,ABC-type transport system involved in Fe-S cluster assembly, ATPase component,FeS assembly ATPase SufC,ABC transporter [Chlamydia serpentis]
MLRIEHLHAGCNDVKILDDFNLHIQPGTMHVIMGPNGAGKSTLAKILAGDESVLVSSGKIVLQDKNLLSMLPEERSRSGLFIGFQSPPEIPGVNNKMFLRDAYNARRRANQEEDISIDEFNILLSTVLETYDYNTVDLFLDRNVNEGFSGGERKRNEICQMLVLEPEMVLLDEPDSGLDVDALRLICRVLERYRELHPRSALCIVTHNPKLGNLMNPDFVHLLLDGRVALAGDVSLMQELEEKSYQEVIGRVTWR